MPLLRFLHLLAVIVAVSVLCAAGSSVALAKPEIPYELQDIGIDEKLGAQVDLNLQFRNEKNELVPLRSVVNGRKPVALFLVYYSCPSLCNFFLNGSLEVLKKLDMTPGRDFQILTATIDPREDSKLASEKKKTYLAEYGRAGVDQGWHFWVSENPLGHDGKLPEWITTRDAKKAAETPATSVRALAEQVGFKYRYNKDDEQFAHSSAMIILTPEGRVSRYLYGIQFEPKDLKLALIEAGGSKIGNVMDRLLLFCYHYDPKTRKYALFATNLMRAAGALTVLVLGLWLGLSWRKTQKMAA